MENFDGLDRLFIIRQLAEEDRLGRILEQEDIDIEGRHF